MCFDAANLTFAAFRFIHDSSTVFAVALQLVKKRRIRSQSESGLEKFHQRGTHPELLCTLDGTEPGLPCMAQQSAITQMVHFVWFLTAYAQGSSISIHHLQI